MRWFVLLFFSAWALAYDTQPTPETARVVSVYDGDTFTLDNGDKVRLRWVNTPEKRPKEPFADEATRFTRDFVEGQEVRLIPAARPRDAYGRLVAGVANDKGNLSVALVRAGLAHVFIIPPDDTDASPLIEAQAEARQARRGIWSTSIGDSPIHMTSFHANASGDDERNINGEYMRLCNTTTESFNMSGWKLRNERGETFTIPDVTIPAGHTIRVHSGTGLDALDPRRQLTVHLRSERPIWSNDYDVAALLAPNGREVVRRVHGKR
jgi:micrococcal nuclease